MSGLAVMINADDTRVDEMEFDRFVERVARYKAFRGAPLMQRGAACRASKFNTHASFHRGVVVDPRTGSWLMAAGTVVDTQEVSPDRNLCSLLTDYLAQGNAVFARCDGQFALVIYDAAAHKTVVVSDPFGYFSIFYGTHNGQLFLATSALAVAEQIQAPLNAPGVDCFLYTGKVFGEMTLWHGVKRMSAASVLEYDAGLARETKYWTPTPDTTLGKLSLEDAIACSTETVGNILTRNLAPEGKVWSDLTGGFDTRFLTFFLDRMGLPFKSNFVGPAEQEDVRIAQEIVNKFHWEHQHFELPGDWHNVCTNLLIEALGRGDTQLNVLLLLRALWVHKQECREYTTLLSGLGGEMWRGIAWWPERGALDNSSIVHYDRQLWSLMHPVPQEVLADDARARVKSELVEQFRAVGEREPEAPNTFKLDCVWTYRETGHVGAWTSFGAGLVRILPPLFSKDIVRHVMSLDYRWRVNNALVKHILEKHNRALANIEVEGRGPAIPMRFTNLHRFVPSRVAQGRKAANKFSEVTFGKTLWTNHRAEGYSRGAWRRAILQFARRQNLLEPKTMRSGKLYNADALSAFLADAETDQFRHDEFLGRILTVEMGLHATGGGLE